MALSDNGVLVQTFPRSFRTGDRNADAQGNGYFHASREPRTPGRRHAGNRVLPSRRPVPQGSHARKEWVSPAAAPGRSGCPRRPPFPVGGWPYRVSMLGRSGCPTVAHEQETGVCSIKAAAPSATGDWARKAHGRFSSARSVICDGRPGKEAVCAVAGIARMRVWRRPWSAHRHRRRGAIPGPAWGNNETPAAVPPGQARLEVSGWTVFHGRLGHCTGFPSVCVRTRAASPQCSRRLFAPKLLRRKSIWSPRIRPLLMSARYSEKFGT